MKPDFKDGVFAVGVLLAGLGLYLLHPKALEAGIAVLGSYLVIRSVR